MARTRKEPDPRFWKLNRSVSFDTRLAPYDIRQSRVHLGELSRIGVISEDDARSLDAALQEVAAEFDAESFEFIARDEDIHMAIERRLGEICGTDVAGRLHTGRSRNDQVATDLAMFTADHADRAALLLADVQAEILRLARIHAGDPLPGYTHLQRAQPVYLGHHLMAYFWMFGRDRRRFEAGRAASSVLPLGSGAMAGINWDIDRDRLAGELGFDSVSPNSIDGVSNRDFALDYLAAASICASHLSRLGSELVLWSSTEFGFVRLDEGFTSGSSIMPQKQNPDSAELLRAKSGRVAADFQALLGVLHGLPLTYSKDLQEDKEPLFDAADTIEASLEMLVGMLEGIEFLTEEMVLASADEMLAATEIADMLVRKGLPFREAPSVVGDLVRLCLESGRSLSELGEDELKAVSDLLDAEYFAVLKQENWLESKRTSGGTSRVSLESQFELAESHLDRTGDDPS